MSAELPSTIALRCSQLPLALACPGSVRDGGMRVDPVSGDGDLGTAAHEAFRPLVERGAVEWDDLPALAARHDVDPEQLRMLASLATKLWRTENVGDRHMRQGALTELPLSADIAPGVTLSGTSDIRSTHPLGVAYIDDWKTGFVDRSYREQMLGYCALALLDDPTLEVAYARLLWVRSGDVEAYSMKRSELGAWRGRVLHAILQWNGTYHPGDHCEHCPLAHSCKARGAMARADVATLQGVPEPIDLSALAPAEIMRLRDVAHRMETLAANVKNAIRDHVLNGGVVEGDGHRLVREVTNPRALDTLKTWDVLTAEGFTDADWQAVIDLSVKKIEQRVAAKAGKGKGAAAVRALAEKLEAAGAVTREEKVSIQKRRIA